VREVDRQPFLGRISRKNLTPSIVETLQYRCRGTSDVRRYTEETPVQRVRFLFIGIFLLAACATQKAPPQSASDEQGQPSREVLPRTIVTPEGAADVEELFRSAEEQAKSGDHAGAARSFDRLVRLDPDGPLVPEALQRAGIEHEQAGDRHTSLSRFEELGRRFPKHALGREGLLRSIRLLCFLERWQRCGEASDMLLSRYTDLDPYESVVGLSGKALALVAKGDDEKATHFIEKGRTIIEDHQLDRAGAVPRDLAQLYFALGETRRMRAERIKFNPVPANFAMVLEQRCQLLLDAQSAYSDSMRAYDAHWSAMAGYRVGELYQKLHEDVMAIPKPAGATTDAKKQLFEGAMRLRYSILLDKALSMMTHTLSMSKRTGENSSWVARAEEARQKIERGIQAEKEALDKLPYTRADLQKALDDLQKKAEEEEKKKKDKAKR
jgi:tetratricopeptide (TPR) repeat protein